MAGVATRAIQSATQQGLARRANIAIVIVATADSSGILGEFAGKVPENPPDYAPHKYAMESFRVDRYIVESLMPDLVGHDRRPSAYLVYMCLWCRTHGVGNASISIALLDIAEATGLAKRTTQQAIAWLEHRKLIVVTRATLTDVGTFSVLTPWMHRRR